MSKSYELIKGDSALKLKGIKSSSVDAVITDPPYLLLDHKLDRPFDEDVIFNELYRVLKDDGMLVIFGRGVSLARWVVKLDELGFKFREEVIWAKTTSSTPFTPIQRKHEMMIVFTKGEGKLRKVRVDPRKDEVDWGKTYNVLRTLSNYLKKPGTLEIIEHYIKTGENTYGKVEPNAKHSPYNIPNGMRRVNDGLKAYKILTEGRVERSIITVGVNHRGKVHPTEKPVQLMERLINITTDEGDVILDPFTGSASTGVAALNLDRQFIGIEIDDEYYKTAEQRLKESSNINK